ncbi:hypothetical protein GCM10010191_04650 [Actinomadura vinacea]|uniref:Uncharacterized protein n=1 Tax=Actinomadura vinacea TaxID=115336 RepID=A0ABN3ID96_9ACTN
MARNVVAAERRRAAAEQTAARRAGGRRYLASDDLMRLEEQIEAEAVARRTGRWTSCPTTAGC